jgi:type 1 fimbria pilin
MKKFKSYLSSASLLALVVFQPYFAHAEIAGNVGKIRVYGALVESPCQLQMETADQSVNLGNIQTADLEFIGDKAHSTPFIVQLQDCIQTNTKIKNYKMDTDTWSTYQPGFKIRFLAESAQNFPNLVAVNGAKGIGLQLSENDGSPIDLGTDSKPLLVEPPQDAFRYWITPIKISQLEPNAFHSIISFELIYE